MSQPSIDYDVCIVGSGLVGMTLAVALAQERFNVALLDTQSLPQADLNQTDIRTYAITRASERIFQKLNVWSAMEALRVSPFRQMFVWDANGTGEVAFDSAQLHEPVLGHIVEQQVMQTALQQQIDQQDRITVLRPVKLQRFSIEPFHVNVVLQNNTMLSARLLVGAEGAHSVTRQWAGIALKTHDYAQQGLVGTVHTEQPHQETAWQRFLDDGILAFLPLSDPHQCSIVWSTATPKAQTLLYADKADFLSELSEAFAYKLGAVVDVETRAAFGLQRRHAMQYVQPRFALIGDAAHTVHPLAGQGVNLGLLDAAALAEVVRKAQRSNEDIGLYNVLRRYERWRKGDNYLTQATMDGFKLLFGNQWEMVRWVRNTGLEWVNNMPLLKQPLMQYAMGLRDDLPPLAKV